MIINPVDTEKYISGPHPKWSQSHYINFYDPQSKIGGIIRFGIFEHLKECNDWFIFFIDGKPLYVRNNLNLPYTDSRPDPGMEIAGIRMTALEPLMKCRIEHEAPDIKIDLLCEGRQPMVDCMEISKDTTGALAEEVTYVHMEGTIRMTGKITLKGSDPIEIRDGVGFRDISVGPRNWDFLLCYALSWPVFSNGMAFAGVHAISADGRNAYMKMWYDGKTWLPVKRFEDRNEYEKYGMTIKNLHWRFWDADNRMWEYTGKPLWDWPCPHDTFVVHSHIMEYRLSDGTLGYGLAEGAFRLDSLRPGPAFDLRMDNTLKPL